MESWRWRYHCWSHLRNGGCSRVCQVGQGRRDERGESKRTWSLWTIPWWWRQLTALRTERMTVMASCWVDFPFARMRSKGSPPQKRVIFCARPEALRDRWCWWGLCPDTDFISFYCWRNNLVLTHCPINAPRACERSVWLLKHRLGSEAQGSGEKKCLMSQWLCYAKDTDASRRGCHWDVRKEVEAPLDIKNVTHQISCFSKTIVHCQVLEGLVLSAWCTTVGYGFSSFSFSWL